MSIEALQANVSNLSAGDKTFAESLLSQWVAKGKLSEKQMHWVGVLAEKRPHQPFETATNLGGNFQALVDLFEKAKGHLKYPGVLMLTEAGHKLQVKPTGGSSKYPGTFNVTDGRPYGSNKWYGRLSKDGQWAPSPKVTGEELDEVTKCLESFARNPVTAATQYGRLTGHCCFCGLGLTDSKSTDVGYGPVCAKHFGLPWGKSNG